MDREEKDRDRTVVIAYDGSDNSKDALVLGEQLCRGLDARPVIATVAVLPARLIDDPLMFATGLDELVDQRTEPAIDEARRMLGRSGVEAKKLADTSAGRALHLYCDESRPLALVIGSAHPDHLSRIRIGSTGKRLLSGATCPIAVAPQGFAERSSEGLRRISVAVDEHEESDLALTEAGAIAKRLGGELKIVSVLGFSPLTFGPFPVPVGADMTKLESRRTEQLLEEAAGKVPEGVEVEIEAMVGDPGAMLEQHSGECDLLVVGSRSYGPVRRVLLGSVSAHLMRHAHSALLITPRGAKNPESLYEREREDGLAPTK